MNIKQLKENIKEINRALRSDNLDLQHEVYHKMIFKYDDLLVAADIQLKDTVDSVSELKSSMKPKYNVDGYLNRNEPLIFEKKVTERTYYEELRSNLKEILHFLKSQVRKEQIKYVKQLLVSRVSKWLFGILTAVLVGIIVWFITSWIMNLFLMCGI